ncbi:MAG: hypothetical protein KAH84_05315 [Thiomargarita sp.]|nr:hypothetical protein [Thiomargarita sp.]
MRFKLKYVWYLILFNCLLIGCYPTADEQEMEAVQQAMQFSDNALIAIDDANDFASTMQAANITIDALDKLTDAVIASSDLSTIVKATKKFDSAKFKTIQKLHQFLDQKNKQCTEVLEILLQLDPKVNANACVQESEKAVFACQLNETSQQCQCTRNSLGTCPNNQDCILLTDDICQCQKQCISN